MSFVSGHLIIPSKDHIFHFMYSRKDEKHSISFLAARRRLEADLNGQPHLPVFLSVFHSDCFSENFRFMTVFDPAATTVMPFSSLMTIVKHKGHPTAHISEVFFWHASDLGKDHSMVMAPIKGPLLLMVFSLWHYGHSILCVFCILIWPRLKGKLKDKFLNPQREKYNPALPTPILGIHLVLFPSLLLGSHTKVQESGLLNSGRPTSPVSSPVNTDVELLFLPHTQVTKGACGKNLKI